MKKSALILFAAIFLTACSSNPIKGNFKAQMVNGNKTTIVEEMVEETTVGLLGESTKKTLKRNQKDSVSIELNSDNSYSDDVLSVKFDFQLNYFDVTVINNSDKPINGYIQITFSALDASGANVGDCLANANTVDANGKWKFEALCSGNNIETVRFKDITGF
jgi:uncharacterized protein YcfL